MYENSGYIEISSKLKNKKTEEIVLKKIPKQTVEYKIINNKLINFLDKEDFRSETIQVTTPTMDNNKINIRNSELYIQDRAIFSLKQKSSLLEKIIEKYSYNTLIKDNIEEICKHFSIVAKTSKLKIQKSTLFEMFLKFIIDNKIEKIERVFNIVF